MDRTLFPFHSRFVEIDSNHVHYIDEGSGPTLLLLQGNPRWSFLYRHIIADLRSDFRCIALDYPGFGLSTARSGYQFLPRRHSEVVEAFADQLGLKDLSIMVQDWGGPIGLGFAGRRPELVQRLILGNTFAWPADKGMAAFSRVIGNPLARFLIRRYNTLAKWLIPAGMNRKLTGPELASYMGPFATPASRLPTWIFAHQILASRDYLAEVEAGLTKLRDKLALVVWESRTAPFESRSVFAFRAISQTAKCGSCQKPSISFRKMHPTTSAQPSGTQHDCRSPSGADIYARVCCWKLFRKVVSPGSGCDPPLSVLSARRLKG